MFTKISTMFKKLKKTIKTFHFHLWSILFHANLEFSQ